MFKKGSVILGIIFCVGLGVLLHFTYEWSGYNKIVGYFSTVNESTWEHLKLLFVPVVIYTLLQWLFCKKASPGFMLARVASLLIGMLFIVSTFYTISGIIGKPDISVINISIFVLGVIITFLLTEVVQSFMFYAPKYSNTIAVIIILIFALLFVLWTYNPPAIGLFKEP